MGAEDAGGAVIPGLHYRPAYLDSATHDALLAAADDEPWMTTGGRRMQIHGWTFDAAAHRMLRIGDLPGWASPVAERLHVEELTPFVADQLIVNEYQPGQGISPHIDLSCFDDVIVNISLGSTSVMEFCRVDTGAIEEVFIEPSSALVLSGESRHRWRHHIAPRPEDRWDGRTHARGRRVSLTFRRMRIDS